MRPTIDGNGPAHERRATGVALLPQRVTDDGDPFAARTVLLGAERPPDHGLHAQQWKQIAAHVGAADPLGVVSVAAQQEVSRRFRGKIFEGRGLRAPVEKIGMRGAETAPLADLHGVMLEEEDEAIRVDVRHRPEMYGVDEAEDCRRHANSETERHHGHRREPWLFRQRANGDPQVLPEGVHVVRGRRRLSLPAVNGPSVSPAL